MSGFLENYVSVFLVRLPFVLPCQNQFYFFILHSFFPIVSGFFLHDVIASGFRGLFEALSSSIVRARFPLNPY